MARLIATSTSRIDRINETSGYGKWSLSNLMLQYPMPNCSVNCCNIPAHTRGFCIKHYSRVRRHDDPNIVLRPRHGKAGTKTYRCWADMKTRCNNKNHRAYKSYGGRGIKVCEEWRHSFDSFYLDMGEAPTKNHTIERIDNNGNYEPLNCKWASRQEQSQNRRSNRLLTHKNKTLNVTQWSKIIGVNKNTITYRLIRGWTVERTLTTPTLIKR